MQNKYGSEKRTNETTETFESRAGAGVKSRCKQANIGSLRQGKARDQPSIEQIGLATCAVAHCEALPWAKVQGDAIVCRTSVGDVEHALAGEVKERRTARSCLAPSTARRRIGSSSLLQTFFGWYISDDRTRVDLGDDVVGCTGSVRGGGRRRVTVVVVVLVTVSVVVTEAVLVTIGAVLVTVAET